MDYLPAFHNVKGKLCLVVGGGEVGARKAGVLLDAGARVRVVAPEIEPELAGHPRLNVKAGTVIKLQASGYASQPAAQAACGRKWALIDSDSMQPQRPRAPDAW